MKVSGGLSPNQLALWSAGSSVCVVLFTLLASFAVPKHDHQSIASALQGKPWLAILLVVPLVSALSITPWAWTRLKKGMKQNAWTEAELGPVRRWLDRPVWMWLFLGYFGVFIGLAVWRIRAADLFLFVQFPLQTVLILQRIVTPQTDSSGLMHLATTSAPIRSGQWGRTS